MYSSHLSEIFSKAIIPIFQIRIRSVEKPSLSPPKPMLYETAEKSDQFDMENDITPWKNRLREAKMQCSRRWEVEQ